MHSEYYDKQKQNKLKKLLQDLEQANMLKERVDSQLTREYIERSLKLPERRIDDPDQWERTTSSAVAININYIINEIEQTMKAQTASPIIELTLPEYIDVEKRKLLERQGYPLRVRIK